MQIQIVTNKYGRVKLVTFTREETLNNIFTRGVVYDLYTNLSDFKESILWIVEVIPKEGYTIEDTLDAFVEKHCKTKFVFCKADEVSNDFPVNGTIEEGKNIIDRNMGYILNSGFYNIIFNRKMTRSYGKNTFCLYSNAKTEKFIKNNTGTDKIINRVIESGKVN